MSEIELELRLEHLNEIYPNGIPAYLKEADYFKEYEALIFYVEISETEKQNDGIGSYEYWGCKGYDAGVDYYVCTDIEIDEQSFKETEGVELLGDDLELLKDKLIEVHQEQLDKEAESEAESEADARAEAMYEARMNNYDDLY